MNIKVSMDTIAKVLGVSKNTVSLVFRNIPGVNEKTRARVLETADRLGYNYSKGNSRNEGAFQLVTNILIIIPSSAKDNSGFFSHILFGIESEARKNNIYTVISYYDDTYDLDEIPLSIKEGHVSGIITLGRIKKSVFNSLKKYNLPMIMVDHYYEDTPLDCIISDNFMGGFVATKYLIENGHKELGFLGAIDKSVSFYDRFLGYKKALEQSSLPVTNACVIAKSFEDLAIADPILITEELKELTKLPTAFFCCNDIEAITLIKGLGAIGLQVPQDISVIGFDDIDLAKNFNPELTTIKVQKELLGIKAVQRLVSVIATKDSNSEKLVLSISLLERQSVRALLK